MAYKNQANCYRTVGGVKYFNFCDVLDQSHFEAVEIAKDKKLRHKLVKHPEGYKQLFMHPEDMKKVYGE